MEHVVDAVRRIIMRWVVTRTVLIADAKAGDTSISVKSTLRFRVGDQFLITNTAEDMENLLYVKAIADRHTITLADANGNSRGLKWDWPLSKGATIFKTMDDLLIKAVFFGEPDVITDLPAITVAPQSRSSEVMTFRATKEKFTVEIGIFVSGSTQEEGDRFLQHIADTIQYGLKRNFYPLLNDYKTTTLTADISKGDQHIKVADASIFATGSNEIIIEDEYNIQVVGISAVCDAHTLRLYQVADFDFDSADTIVIKPNRLPFNSWPSDITFGKIKKGTLLKAATISYFVEEMEDHQDASFGDTQLR